MENNYNIVFLFLLAGAAMGLTGMGLATLIRPHKPNDIKLETYECGPATIGKSWIQYNFRFYTYVLVFLLFDVEVVYLIPWAHVFKDIKDNGLIYKGMEILPKEVSGLFIFTEMLVFLLILIIGLIYAWKKGGLSWEKEHKKVKRMTGP
jgi:NADH-quinone oxidoreductase subunit A